MRTRISGYSLIEVMVVVALITIGSSVAVIQMKASMTSVTADTASGLVLSQLKFAREVAVDQRRDVVIEFVDPGTVNVTRLESDGGTTLLSTKTLPPGFAFGLPTGIGDTPDGYGNTNPVFFNGNTSVRFLADGTLIDNAGIVLSGSVFTIGGGNGTARAITVAGANGRVKQYYINGTQWVQR